MLKLTCLLALCLTAVGASANQQRIVGGTITSIGQYPFAAVVLTTDNNVSFRHDCGGTIVNNRSVMSAAHCWIGRNANQQRVRVGSTNAHSGGTVHNVALIITHPNFTLHNRDNDVGLLRVATAFMFGNNVRVAGIAASNFNVGDNQAVWAIGWGFISPSGPLSEQLRHVQLLTVNQNTCRARHNFLTANMLCANWASGGRATCVGDSGGPLIRNNVVVGVTSRGSWNCGDGIPSVYVRVSQVSNWIRSNA